MVIIYTLSFTAFPDKSLKYLYTNKCFKVDEKSYCKYTGKKKKNNVNELV